jgi:hypothetical protein
MNNIDGSYFAAVKFGEMQSKKRKEQEQKELEQKRYEEEKRRSWIQFWVPLIISNLLSFSALIVAILAYIKQ